MQFSKIKLTGFKSFVNATELDIQPGLTGVVGPNGCGKSNIVESLKWVMGETSAKQMRGGEMDDVIFSGTANRPARNIAEVLLTMDNSERDAPGEFNETDTLEISRRIEREKGSTYRVNSKEVRARDVQLLFADQVSGARSTALVGQGHIGEVIAAKPTQRRKLLEEAAGITGLHSRRHEAELRLRGADTNLERLDDILVTLEAQMQSLKKQVRQATRYRNLNDHVRKAEATLFLILWNNAAEELQAAEQGLAEVEREVGEATGAATRAATEQAEAASGLPELRNDEAAAAAALQRLTIARENLEEEGERLEAARRDGEARLEQITEDTSREAALAGDAEQAISRLGSEEAEIGGVGKDEEELIAEAEAHLESRRGETQSAESSLSKLTEKLAGLEARRTDLSRRRFELTGRMERLRQSQDELGAQVSELRTAAVDPAEITEAEENAAAAEEAAGATRAAAETAETARRESQGSADEAVETAQGRINEAARLEAEEKALAELLETGDPDLWPPVVDAITVDAGLESALGAALGDDLSAATDEAAPMHWHQVDAPAGDAPALPGGAEPLSLHVQGPGALNRRLAQIGIVDDLDTGWRLLAELRQGQRLVTRDGAFWRWDGYFAAAEAPTGAAVRLEQRNRLEGVREKLADAGGVAIDAKESADAARAAAEQAARHEADARSKARNAGDALSEARGALAQVRQRATESQSKLSAREETAARLASDIEEAEAALAEAAKEEGALSDIEPVRTEAKELREDVAARRTQLVEAQSAFETLNRRADDRRRRLETITREAASWEQRKSGAIERQGQLAERREALEQELARLSDLPSDIERRRAELLDRTEKAEAERNAFADKLAAGETRLGEADKRLREAEAVLSGARETRVRAEAAVEQAKQAAGALGERIADRLRSKPGELREISGLKEDAEPPELEAAERRVERLIRERENMGPVNLRAETEAGELSEQVETLVSERADLLQAIDKLRRGINELNREGRQRLLASFKEVDTHFQELFVRLFGGGRAHLSLTESDDPLEAGLEIMASPPGKRLQVLSLLSGGEQALTALSLLFAVFLTNPAPICVLDEVDAPLDDANVDRFCSLVEEIAHSLSTRFLVITHHRMTMARVDRLFGVTMGEQGVSQLVSVDLGQAIEMRATA
ncbi:MAG: chromosome segregation protein SMC [Rhodospirillales bacterium]|nr:chromosome segregation protein SMC [Rhodospirillaceae bacterium]MDP6428146.1 chromosome segregation protein SMC [Rhodospirillales bacterium]MDP6642971.1 chromosome segregation protein SMC [Rhodospirillales bacterium]MDP6840726.1 chromosome segregation protein SMC [Rhodospirillales bacterium]